MDPRTTTSGSAARSGRAAASGRAAGRHGRAARGRLRPPAVRRPGLYLGAAAAGAVLVNVLVGAGPAAQADAGRSESVSVAQQLGLTAQSGPVDVTRELEPLEELAASRSTREAQQTAAQQAQAAADQAELDRQAAEAAAAARAAAEAEAEAEAHEQAAGAPSASVAAPAGVAHISNSAGPVRPQVQAAADAVVTNVPGADGITLGGTRASAADPGGHPSGLALDYMVLGDTALGEAIVQYHIAHWAELGVDYIIYRQRILQSPSGSWQGMADRGSATANHMDHVHVNYR